MVLKTNFIWLQTDRPSSQFWNTGCVAGLRQLAGEFNIPITAMTEQSSHNKVRISIGSQSLVIYRILLMVNSVAPKQSSASTWQGQETATSLKYLTLWASWSLARSTWPPQDLSQDSVPVCCQTWTLQRSDLIKWDMFQYISCCEKVDARKAEVLSLGTVKTLAGIGSR